MLSIVKSQKVPKSLQSGRVKHSLQKIEEMLAQGDNPKSRHFDATIYGDDEVREQLKVDQHCKCAYCETSVMAVEGEVEHYRPKSAYDNINNRPAYYWLAYDWNNLLMVCSTCNKQKGYKFPLLNPASRDIANKDISQEQPLLINPCFDNPKDYLEYRTFHLHAKETSNELIKQRGETTIQILGLENRPDLVEMRRRYWRLFIDNMNDNHWSYDETLQHWKQKMIDIGCQPDDIEYLGMFINQALKYLYP